MHSDVIKDCIYPYQPGWIRCSSGNRMVKHNCSKACVNLNLPYHAQTQTNSWDELLLSGTTHFDMYRLQQKYTECKTISWSMQIAFVAIRFHRKPIHWRHGDSISTSPNRCPHAHQDNIHYSLTMTLIGPKANTAITSHISWCGNLVVWQT